MRQGNGSDLLGAHDPRSATIGIVYVAPNDDRESVQAAILTQEHLGREQIAIVMLNQDTARYQPGDFEGLQDTRSKLQANLVIVAPRGSSLAEFARLRRFTYFASLESYGRSLRDAALPVASSPQAAHTMQSPAPAQKTADAHPLPGGDNITFPSRKRTTAEPAPAGAAADDNDSTIIMAPPAAMPWRNSGKAPIVVAPKAGATPAAADRRVRAKLPIVGANPPGTASAAVGGRHHPWSRLVALFVLLSGSFFVCAAVAAAAPGALPGTLRNVVNTLASRGRGVPAATITIAPKSTYELNTYVLIGVTSDKPDRAKRQVQVRQLANATTSQAKTVTATGDIGTPAVQATGSLTFYNGNSGSYTIAAGTSITDASGVVVANNNPLTIPGGSPAVGYGHMTVPAHALTSGSRGNIREVEFNYLQCCGSASVFVSNGAFSGGQDPQHSTAVQQSDIDGVANPLKQPLMQNALAALNGKKLANEQFVTQPTCTSKVTSDQPAGARATSVTVTLSATCSGQVYDQSLLQAIAADLLEKKAMQDLASTYAVVGNVQTGVTRTETAPQGNLTLFVKAEGLWVYRFTATQMTQMAQAIAGKRASEALTMLENSPGVGQVQIATGGNNNPTLPTSLHAISIVIAHESGLARTTAPK